MSKFAKTKSEYDFLLYRIDALEKRLDAIDKTSSNELVSVLLNLLEKKEMAHDPQPVPVPSPTPTPTPLPSSYDALLSFARRRTIA